MTLSCQRLRSLPSTTAPVRPCNAAITESRHGIRLCIKRSSLFLVSLVLASSLRFVSSFTILSRVPCEKFHCQHHQEHRGLGTTRDAAYRASPTSLSGVRSSLRNRFARLSRTLKRDKTPLASQLARNESSSSPLIQILPEAKANHSSSYAVERLSMASLSKTVSNNAATMESNLGIYSNLATATRIQLVSSEGLYSLPPVEPYRRLTKLEVEFRDMLEHFTNYSERDLLSLRDPRMRTLFRGVAASAMEPAVYRAFEVLYEDLYPLRLAGRLVYKMLKELMIKSQAEREEEVRLVISKTGLDEVDVEATRLAFVAVAAELNGDAFLTIPQLAKIEVLSDVAENILDFDSVGQLLQRLNNKNPKQHGKLSFADMIIGLQECAEEMCGLEACNPTAVMHHIMLDLKEHPPSAHNEALDEKRHRFSERYDEMLTAFKEWEDFVPDGEGRRMDVVKGCFVGARNQPVVDALRIVYVDFSPLRVAGDIIFKLVSGVMKARQRNHHR